MSQVFFVGSYTAADFGDYQAAGNGIYSCELSPAGEMKVLHCFEDIANPTYVVLNQARTHLYAVHETAKTDNPAVSAFKINDDYSLTRLNTEGMTGEGPCHLALDETEQVLAVANYSSGNVLLYPLNADGSLAPQADSVQHAGSSVNQARQEGPHAHATVFGPDGTLFVADLGLDEVKGYRIDKDKVKLEPHSSAKTPAGAGPRHLVFSLSGDYALVLNELDSTLSLFHQKGGQLELLDTVTTLPADFEGETTCAAIKLHPSGKVVYASNRGHDSVAVFAFDEAAPSLSLVQHVSTNGKVPRDFSLSPGAEMLIAANQQSNTLFSYRVDDTGRLEPTGQRLDIGSPVCVAMV